MTKMSHFWARNWFHVLHAIVMVTGCGASAITLYVHLMTQLSLQGKDIEYIKADLAEIKEVLHNHNLGDAKDVDEINSLLVGQKHNPWAALP